MNEIIKLKNVIKMIGTHRIIGGINLSIGEKEHIELCGEGSDMLMRIMAGMEAPSSGEVFIDGKAIHEMNGAQAAGFRNRNIGVARSDAALPGRLSVLENVSLPLTIRRTPNKKRKKAANELLEALDLAQVSHALPCMMSEYERRLTALAQALITQPKVLMLQNILFGLSERETEKMSGTLNAIKGFGDYTVLIFDAAHTLSADRSLALRFGKIMEGKE